MAILLRWRLTRQLLSYQAFKHVMLFDPLIIQKNDAVSLLATNMKARCVTLADTYTAHVKRWPENEIGRDWNNYKEQAMAMLLAIRRHLTRELRESEQLLISDTRNDP